VFIATYNVKKQKTEFFTKQSNPNDLMSFVSRASSAAPTYYDTFEYNDHTYMDGGLTCNNPVLSALGYAKN